MSNLTVDTILVARGRDNIAIQAKNAVQFYVGSLVGIDTNASGRAARWADTASFKFLGVAQRNVLGNTGASQVPEVEVDASGPILERVTVTGVTAVTDQGKKVYCSTDNRNDLTLTATTNVKAIGVIVRWHSSTTCDVKLFTPEEYDNQGVVSDITALTDSSGGAAANGTIEAITAPTALTDNGGGTADGTVASMAAPTATVDNGGGGAADGTIGAITGDQSVKDAVTELVAQDNNIRTSLTTLQDNFKELTTAQGQNRTAIVALTDAVKELATKLNEVISDLNLA